MPNDPSIVTTSSPVIVPQQPEISVDVCRLENAVIDGKIDNYTKFSARLIWNLYKDTVVNGEIKRIYATDEYGNKIRREQFIDDVYRVATDPSHELFPVIGQVVQGLVGYYLAAITKLDQWQIMQIKIEELNPIWLNMVVAILTSSKLGTITKIVSDTEANIEYFDGNFDTVLLSDCVYAERIWIGKSVKNTTTNSYGTVIEENYTNKVLVQLINDTIEEWNTYEIIEGVYSPPAPPITYTGKVLYNSVMDKWGVGLQEPNETTLLVRLMLEENTEEWNNGDYTEGTYTNTTTWIDKSLYNTVLDVYGFAMEEPANNNVKVNINGFEEFWNIATVIERIAP